MTKKVCARSLIVLLSAVCLTSIATAQTGWWRTYGGTGNDGSYSVQLTPDGGYIVAGYTGSYGNGGNDVYLIKTNAQGDTLWTMTYGGTNNDYSKSIQRTSDGGYIVAGATSFYYGHGNNEDVYLIKTNVSGDTLWTKTYGGTSMDRGYSVQQTSDGGYIIAGLTFSFKDTTNGDVYLIKTNASGDTLWTRTYGGTGTEFGSFVQRTRDSNYIVAGYTSSRGAGGSDVWLINTNASGDTLWTRTYGGANGDEGYAVQQTVDGGYIVAGRTVSFGQGDGDVYLIKTTASGDMLWTRTYGGTSDDCGFSVRQTADGGYVIAGYTYFGTAHEEVYLVKADSSGDTFWTRTYGGHDYDQGYSVQQTTDGGYIIAGSTLTLAGFYDSDVYLIKTDANGHGIQEPLVLQPARSSRLVVRPNPFTSSARVPGHENELFVLSDVTGRQVAVCRGGRIGAGLGPGVYFLSPVGSKAGKAATAAIVKTAF